MLALRVHFDRPLNRKYEDILKYDIAIGDIKILPFSFNIIFSSFYISLEMKIDFFLCISTKFD